MIEENTASSFYRDWQGVTRLKRDNSLVPVTGQFISIPAKAEDYLPADNVTVGAVEVKIRNRRLRLFQIRASNAFVEIDEDEMKILLEFFARFVETGQLHPELPLEERQRQADESNARHEAHAISAPFEPVSGIPGKVQE